jgi:hypothetical protein
MMPHPEEKKRRLLHRNDAVTASDVLSASLDDIGVDVLAKIYGFLPIENIMCLRGINKKSREAVKMTLVPPTALCFCVDNEDNYNAMRVITRAMPNIQQIELSFLGDGHKWSDGEDPDEEVAARTAHWTAHDIEIISNFNKLRILSINSWGTLNGRYPFLFNSFPLLQKLEIQYCHYLKWDLEILAGLPLLKELDCFNNSSMTGSIMSLRVLKDTLEKVKLDHCENIEGNFMDLADFPYLKELNLFASAVTGDIRDVGENDFSSLEELILSKTVYGGMGYEFQRISDAPALIRAVYLFKKQRPTIKFNKYWDGKLSEDSPDWYESAEDDDDTPPFYIRFIEAGSRIGYRWQTDGRNPCEVNWLDPEPDRESSEYAKYTEKLRQIVDEVKFYSGFHQPPTEEEYRRLVEDYESDSESYREYNESESDE